MGHHYRYQFTYTAVTNLAAGLALWELHQTTPASALPIYVWDFQLTISNSDAAAAAGNIVLRLQREATLIHTAGAGAGVVALVSTNAPATGATVRTSATAGPAGLTSAGATTAGCLASFGLTAFFVGATQTWRLTPERHTGDVWSPICVVKGTEQLALVVDTVAIPASTAFLVTGSVGWSEGP